jgi:glucose/mannose-6-phosphate isomerase
MDLDNHKKIQQKDTYLIAESISNLPNQLRQVLADAGLIKIPGSYGKVNRIVINGMGGSNLGGRIVKHLFSDRLTVPLEICPGYRVPGFVDNKTLYLLSSYSGNTEEVLAAYKQAKDKGAKIMAITAGGESKGKLEKLMIKDDIPGYIFYPEYNPSGQPRMGLGYSIFGILFLLKKAGFVAVDDLEIRDIAGKMETGNKRLVPTVKTENNIAKKIALELKGKQPVLVGSEFLLGNLHAFRNQLCENSKNFAVYLPLPDLNHYLLESLKNPAKNTTQLAFVFFNSKLYHARVQRRSKLTREVVDKNNIKTLEYDLKGKTKLAQSAELLQLGSWISFYLSALNNVNAGEIPWVNWFKEQLK